MAFLAGKEVPQHLILNCNPSKKVSQKFRYVLPLIHLLVL